MKKIFVLIPTLAIFLLSCNNDKKTTVETKDAEIVAGQTDTTKQSTFIVDTALSSLQWEGYEGLSIGKPEHNGGLKINMGYVNLQDNKLEGAKFVVPVNSLTVADIPVEKPGNAKLKGHLLSADFFDAAKFPDASFELTSAAPNGNDSTMVTGNLSLKGIAKSISFSMATKMEDNTFLATSPKFYINRKDWGIVYRSENSLGDELIRPEIGIVLNIVAKK